jgi:hypothetical protein
MSQTDLADEALVREALQHATEELSAPVLRLASEATVRGRRLRLRRRVTLAAATVCAASAVVVPLVVALGDNPARDADVASDPSVSLPDPLPVSDVPGWWDMPATEMLRRLEDATPARLTYTEPVLTNEGENGPGEPVGVMRGWMAADVVADGDTAGGINVLLYAPGALSRDQWTCPGNLAAPDRCSEITDDTDVPVGRVSVTTTGRITIREVVLRQDDGGLVYVAASNSADDKWGGSSVPASEQVPLSMAELLDIAGHRQWTTYEPR